MNLNKIAKYLAIPALAMVLLAPLIVWAQLPTVSPPIVPGTSLAEVENLIRRVAQFILVLGVIAALIYIVLGGIAWMRAGDDQTKIGEAKTKIWSGVWGAL